jgi:hypothetical protein
VLYASDVSLWLGLACLAAVGAYAALESMSPPRHMWLVPIGVVLVLACEIAFMYRLIVAFRSYLRFDRPAATVLTAQFILWLTLACVVLLLKGYS